jgi:hypothetical protein
MFISHITASNVYEIACYEKNVLECILIKSSPRIESS